MRLSSGGCSMSCTAIGSSGVESHEDAVDSSARRATRLPFASLAACSLPREMVKRSRTLAWLRLSVTASTATLAVWATFPRRERCAAAWKSETLPETMMEVLSCHEGMVGVGGVAPSEVGSTSTTMTAAVAATAARASPIANSSLGFRHALLPLPLIGVGG